MPRESVGLRPLEEFGPGETYKGYSGGLYGEGRNEPPPAHRAAAMEAARSIQPLGPDGKPDPGGKIVLISNGMSNTTREFQRFVQMAGQAGAQSAAGGRRLRPGRAGGQRLGPLRRADFGKRGVIRGRFGAAASASRRHAGPGASGLDEAGAAPAGLAGRVSRHAQALQADQAEVLRQLRQAFPNLKLAYLSSRIYAGFAGTTQNPEPYAYESAWANQWLIQQQISGDPA